MGSATRSALAHARTALDSEKKLSLATGSQLLEAARAVAGSAGLRSVLADPAVPATEKSRLIGRAFPGVDATAGRLLAGIAESRWSNPDELVDAIEELGIRVIAASTSGATLEGELFSFGRTITSTPELELALGSKLGDPTGKAVLVERLLGSQASPSAIAILGHLVQSPRGRRVRELIDRATRIVADASGRVIAKVTSAVPLSAPQRERLEKALAIQHGRDVLVDVIIDPAVLGGLRVQVEGEVVDGTIATRLTDLRLQLAG